MIFYNEFMHFVVIICDYTIVC